ncbi:hypothetical protein [Azohydromonas sediminis]|uniref:hypothetical protein n=1 Tax=Azohydromonas sediminis TaxID=2259674 RepID=UPI001F3188BB|nr:hypothetical protein [Azohydromonas sediminis]
MAAQGEGGDGGLMPQRWSAALGAWLDRVPLALLVALAAWLAIAPVVPEPHLWQKLKMLAAGTLTRPLDIFDLVFHAAPIALLAWRLLRQVRGRGGSAPR